MKDKKPPVGIDLGTTFSVVAYLDAKGTPRTISNAEGDLTTPSVVLFEEDGVVVGKEAVKLSTIEPDRVARLAKREFGNPLFSKSINGEFLPPEVVQALVLRKLKQDAEAKIGPIQEAVISVPAYFNEPRRKATQDAGRIAGLEVLDIINEPTAAAIAYGVHGAFLDEHGRSRKQETVLIYDLGGGTFDVSVVRIDGGRYEVLATDGNVRLGGVDWDEKIVDHVAAVFEEEHRLDPRRDPASYQRLLREVEDAKRALSSRDKVTITVEHAGKAVRLSLTRSGFEAMTAHLVDRTRFTASKVLEACGLRWGDVTRLLLVGGSTRMPMIAEMLERESEMAVDHCLAVDEAVAHGAAIWAGLLRRSQQPYLHEVEVTNVNSHSLGVLAIESRTGRAANRVMIEKNTPLPAHHSAKFRTHVADQRSVVVNVIEGGDQSGNNSTPIGKCVVRSLPAGLPKGTKVRVKFRYGTNGRLTVEASVPDVNTETTIEIDRGSGLDDGEITAWSRRVRNGMRLGTQQPQPSTTRASDAPSPPTPRTGPPPLPRRSGPPPLPDR